jgi:hypothetical protein
MASHFQLVNEGADVKPCNEDECYGRGVPQAHPGVEELQKSIVLVVANCLMDFIKHFSYSLA